MKRVKVLSIINTIYNGFETLIWVLLGVVVGSLGYSLLYGAEPMSGEVIAGFFAVMASAMAIVVSIIHFVSFVSGIITNIKSRKKKDDERAFIKTYLADSIIKLIVNVLSALFTISSLVNDIADGKFRNLVFASIFYVFAGLSTWQFIEVIKGMKKENID